MMNKTSQPSHAISGVFVFLLLGVFAVFSTVMVLLGAGSYKGISEKTAANNNGRIIASYVRAMVRSLDETGTVLAEDVDGIPTVALVYEDEEGVYYTRIYVYDGMLRERLYSAEEDFAPERGNEICPAEALTASMDRGLLSVEILAEGALTRVDMALRARAREVAP